MDLGLGVCSGEEKDLSHRRKKGLCHEIGTYCAEKLLGICIRKKRSSCCFPSKLARIVHEQGREQLGIDWGEAESPECRGFTDTEISRINFDKLDLREVFEDVAASIRAKTTAVVQRNLSARAQDIDRMILGSIDLATMSYFNNQDRQCVIFWLANNSIITKPIAPQTFVGALKGFGTDQMRPYLAQGSQKLSDSFLNCPVQTCKVFKGIVRDENTPFIHHPAIPAAAWPLLKRQMVHLLRGAQELDQRPKHLPLRQEKTVQELPVYTLFLKDFFWLQNLQDGETFLQVTESNSWAIYHRNTPNLHSTRSLRNNSRILAKIGVVFLVCWSLPLPASSLSFFGRHAEGWHWYEQPPVFKTQKRKSLKHPSLRTSSETLKAFRRKVEELKETAVMDPSFENVRSYMEIQKILLDRASRFSQRWLEVVYRTPHLDYTLKHPVASAARHVYLDEQKREMEDQIKALSKTYGLFFFFSSSCAYCRTFAPIVKRFSEVHGWKVLAISTDGSRLSEFPEAKTDNGASKALGVKALPALLAVDPVSGNTIPLSYGMSTLDQIEDRIRVLILRRTP